MRRRQTPTLRASGEALAGRWEGPRIVERAVDADARLDTLRSLLDGMTHADIEGLPYSLPNFDVEALWSLYSGGIHAFDVMRQYGF